MTQNNIADKAEVKKFYSESGALELETPYVDGKMHGIEKYYYESGDLCQETPNEDGKIHGIEKRYYESGDLHWEAPYVDGKMHGIAKSYDEDKTNIEYVLLYKEGHKVNAIEI